MPHVHQTSFPFTPLHLLPVPQLKPLASELERLDTSLYATRKSLAAEEVELQKLKAQHAVTEQQLAGLKIAKEVCAWLGRGPCDGHIVAKEAWFSCIFSCNGVVVAEEVCICLMGQEVCK